MNKFKVGDHVIINWRGGVYEGHHRRVAKVNGQTRGGKTETIYLLPFGDKPHLTGFRESELDLYEEV